MSEYHAFQVLLQIPEQFLVRTGDPLRRDSRHRGDHLLDFIGPDGFLPLSARHEPLGRACFVDHVDYFVREFPVVQIAAGQVHRRADTSVRVFDFVVDLESRSQAFDDLDCLFRSRLIDVDLLKSSREGAVLFKVLSVFLVRCRTETPQISILERRLEKVRCVHRAAASRARAHDGVNFVDEKDGASLSFKFRDHAVESLLEVSAIPRAGEEGAHFQRINHRLRQWRRRLAFHDLLRYAFRDRGLADTRIAHEQRVVLVAPQQNLAAARHFRFPPHQRIDVSLLGLLVQIDAVLVERRRSRLCIGLLLSAFELLLGSDDIPRFLKLGILRNSMGDELDGVVPGHPQGFQDFNGVAVAFAEQGHKNIRSGDFAILSRRPHMRHRPMKNSLEALCRHRSAGLVASRFEVVRVFLEVVFNSSFQDLQVDVAGAEDFRSVRIIGKRKQQMVKRYVFVAVQLRDFH